MVHVSDSSPVHHQQFSTVHTAMVYVTQVCWQLASRIRMELQFHPDPGRKPILTSSSDVTYLLPSVWFRPPANGMDTWSDPARSTTVSTGAFCCRRSIKACVSGLGTCSFSAVTPGETNHKTVLKENMNTQSCSVFNTATNVTEVISEESEFTRWFACKKYKIFYMCTGLEFA